MALATLLILGCGDDATSPAPERGVPLDATVDRGDSDPRDGGVVLRPSDCSLPEVLCGDTCIDPSADPDHCGADQNCAGGSVCGAGSVCLEGECAFTCPGDLLACDRTCVDPDVSLTHCGATDSCLGSAAGELCGEGRSCLAGRCGCGLGLLACEVGCVDPANDSRHCGAVDDCLADNGGVACGSEQECRDGACEEAGIWTAAIALEDADEETSLPRLSVSTSGAAVIAWIQNTGTTQNAWASVFDPTTARFGRARQLETLDGNVALPFVAITAAGDAAALWDQQGTDRDVWLALYSAATGRWSPAVAVEAEAGRVARAMGLAWLPTGELLAYWNDAGAPTVSVHDGATGAQVRVDALATGVTGLLGYEIDSLAGHGLALFRTLDGGDDVLWSASRDGSTGDWTTQEITRVAGIAVREARGRLATDGFALAVWRQGLASEPRELWASAKEGGTWGSPFRLDEESGGTSSLARLSVAASGDALVVLRQQATCLASTNLCQDVGARRYLRATGDWSAVVALEGSDAQTTSPSVSGSTDGDAVAVWSQPPSMGTPAQIWTRRYSASTDMWSASVSHGLAGRRAVVGTAGLADTGGVVVAWRQDEGGRRNVWASAFLVGL